MIIKLHSAYLCLLIWGFFWFLLGCSNKYTIEQDKSFQLVITQQPYHTALGQQFLLDKYKLVIEEGVFPSKEKQGLKRRYFKRISPKAADKLIHLIENQQIYTLKDYYAADVICGFTHWEIALLSDKKSKNIYVSNLKIPEIDTLFSAVNAFIPKRKPKLTRVYIN